VILIGGLDSTKEEYYRFENILLARGLATFAVDGPGQGEVWYKMKARYDFEKPVTAVVDYLVKRKDIDAERLGIFGRSTGGYYVSRAVAFEKRIKACCCLGCVDFSIFDSHARRLKDGWTYVSGKRNWDEARAYFRSFTLKGVADKITCPLYILHGSKDPIMPNETAIWLSKQAKGPTTLDLCEGGHHGCFNTPGGHITQPRMADWLARTLTGTS
jgi:2,6-dihydroxypseudooxynicotine hydrolase